MPGGRSDATTGRHPGSASEAQQVPAFPLKGGCRIATGGWMGGLPHSCTLRKRMKRGFGGAERRQKGDGKAVRGKPFPRPPGGCRGDIYAPLPRAEKRMNRGFGGRRPTEGGRRSRAGETLPPSPPGVQGGYLCPTPAIRKKDAGFPASLRSGSGA